MANLRFDYSGAGTSLSSNTTTCIGTFTGDSGTLATLQDVVVSCVNAASLTDQSMYVWLQRLSGAPSGGTAVSATALNAAQSQTAKTTSLTSGAFPGGTPAGITATATGNKIRVVNIPAGVGSAQLGGVQINGAEYWGIFARATAACSVSWVGTVIE